MNVKYKKWLIILGILLSICIFMGMSYAYYIKSYSQENSNIVKTKCLNLSIANEKNDIKLDEQYPIPDSEGKKLTPYQFTITNTCEQFISYSVNLEALEGTTMDSNAIKVMVNNEAPANLATLDTAQTSIDNSVEARTLVTGSLGSGDSIDYALRLWMDYGDSADLSSMNKVFNSKVVVTATIGTYKPSDYVSTLHDAILVNEYGVTEVDNAIKKIEAKGTPDLSKTAPIITWNIKENGVKTVSINKAHPSIIGKTEYGGQNLNENDSLILLGTDYSFDTATGNYKILNYGYYDPTLLDLSNNTYFSCASEEISILSDGSLKPWSATSCPSMYKLLSASKEDYGEENSNKYRVKYLLKSVQYIQSENENDKSDRGLYYLNDDYGKSYYYRGNVKNNNVLFGGFYWQIIRINGDSSIRLLYNGTSKDGSIASKTIGTSKYNDSYYSSAYVGYMYGKIQDSRENNIKNEVSSTIKIKLDSWYKENILDKQLEKYVSDSGFCNDRSIANGDGYIKNTSYGARGRNYNITFSCPDKENDLFTTSSNTIGNKALQYPIGLITYDELIGSGMGQNINTLAYTFLNLKYWTMSPSTYSESNTAAKVYTQYIPGYVNGGNDVTNKNYVRPVINLKADVETTGGIGTINDPYIIKS